MNSEMKASVILLLSFILAFEVASTCDTDAIQCPSDGMCIPQRYICDSDDDCEDGSDENSQLCRAWMNDDCDRNEIRCEKEDLSFCITIQEYCTMENPRCNGDLDRRICQMLEYGILEDLENFVVPEIDSSSNLNKSLELAEKFREVIPNTLSHKDCPRMFTLVGDQCLSIFHIGSMAWAESREFCKILGGDLLTFKNVSHYGEVVRHLKQYEMTSDFWVGGSYEDESQGWTWLDGSPIELGSPFWATRYSPNCVNRNVTVSESEDVCYQYQQAPAENERRSCVSLSFELFFYMANDDCVRNMSPLCVFTGENEL